MAMSGEEKINALDFVINTLKEHEKTLSQLEEKLENIVSKFEGLRASTDIRLNEGKKFRSLIFHLNDVEISIIIKDREIHIVPK